MTRLRAPSGDGELLQEPPLADVPGLARRTREIFAATPWAELRAEARREVLALAKAEAPPDALWFVAGHQPELFHPGVWVKNFALAGLARRTGGFALNLVVDNDTIKTTSVRVPVRGADGWPALESVPFDRWTGEAPWEERFVADEGLFTSFGERIAEKMRPWGIEPLAVKLWPEVLKRDGPIGARFAGARRRMEREWGCFNVEVPLSKLCATRAFGRFVGMLLEDLPRFVAVHNAAAAAYRKANGIKSKSHPVPDLAVDGDWFEVPLWWWKPGDTRRERVFVRSVHTWGEFRARGSSFMVFHGDDWPGFEPQQDPDHINVPLHEYFGNKIRSRALATTLFARLFLADVFLHGIGGGKYDELADLIIRDYFGVEPPPFAVLSATCRLPLPLYPSSDDDVSRLQVQARELEWNPQRFVPGHPADAERRALLAALPATRRARREWFARLRSLLEPMRQHLGNLHDGAKARLATARREADANALLRRRDYPFVLFPEARLLPVFRALG